MLQNKLIKKLKHVLRNKALLLFLLFIFILILYFCKLNTNAEFKNPEIIELNLIQKNSLIGYSQPYYINPETEAREKAIEILLAEIIRRESGGDASVCNYNSCREGMGLCQFISSTWNSTLKRMKKDNIIMDNYCWQNVTINPNKNHPIFNPTCHLIVCKWLLEIDGIKHWTSDDNSWGTGPYN